MSTEAQHETTEAIDAYAYLIVGSILGLVLMLAPLCYPSWWWGPLVGTLRDGYPEGAWKPGLVAACVFAGLAVMFGFFQAARKYERTDVLLRRVLYGYNAFLTLLLVFWILLIVNVYIQVRASRYLDATEGGFHSISDVMQRFISEIDRPVRLYIVLPERSEIHANMVGLAGRLRDINPRYVDYEEVSPTLNSGRIKDLVKKFPQLTGESVIVSFGEKEDQYSVIPAAELETMDFDAMGETRTARSFNGEVRLLQELTYLSENKKQPVIYLTQGHGELDEAAPGPDGMASFRLKLMQAKYDVRTLKFPADLDPDKAVVPADADVVIVCGPKRPMGPAIGALRKYLSPTDPAKPKGKLIVLLGPTPPDKQNGNQMTQTGLESLLREFSVNVTGEQVLTLALPTGEGFALDRSPQRVVVMPFKEAIESRHPIAQSFQDQPMQWIDCRKIEPAHNEPGGPSRFNAQPVMGSYGLIWREADMSKQVGVERQSLLTDTKMRQERVTDQSQSIMVAVTVTADPHAGPSGQGPKPRLLAIGTSSIATNQFQSGQAGLIDFDLLRGCIDWLRERYANIGVQPKTHTAYIVPKVVTGGYIFWLPSFLMLLTIFGFGLIVWNIRRR